MLEEALLYVFYLLFLITTAFNVLSRSQDLAVYKLIGEMANLEIAEMCARSGANCGSLFLDLRFRELVKALLGDHPAHLDAASLAYFMHSFSETDKLSYMGEMDDGMLHLNDGTWHVMT
jgi:hypothetical protein